MISRTFFWAVFCAVFLVQVSGGRLLQRHARAPPPGQTMMTFSKTCEYCGEVFGGELTYKCLFDPTFTTYKQCLEGLPRPDGLAK